jgi:uncharacterized protein
MDNNVVNAVCKALVHKSFICLKFNFRGVNGSQGIFDNGRGEKEDVLSAVSFMTSLKEVDQNAIGLVGYSAGAAWGLAAACLDPRVKAVSAISPPLSMSDFSFLNNYALPKLVISGQEDDFIPTADFKNLCNKIQEPKECYSIPEADHFWIGFESEIADKIATFFVKYLRH